MLLSGTIPESNELEHKYANGNKVTLWIDVSTGDVYRWTPWFHKTRWSPPLVHLKVMGRKDDVILGYDILRTN